MKHTLYIYTLYKKSCKHNNTKIENIRITLATTITTKKVNNKSNSNGNKHDDKDKNDNYNNKKSKTEIVIALIQPLKQL